MMLDATAAYRSMWFDKNYEDCVYIDKRKKVKPTIVCVWEHLPFPDNIFDTVLFDPPHTNPGETGKGIMSDVWGALNAQKMVPSLYQAFRELIRVLKEEGHLIFKWNTHKKPLDRVLTLCPLKPLFGHKTAFKTKHSSQTFWIYFVKPKIDG
jgi:ubiquinone/menaquinone biosynthesis C-methylase UbiE